jgi:nitrite reductase/ring-hydroxylating ferredoxin subunit
MGGMMEVDTWTKVASVDDVPIDGTLRTIFRDQPVCLYNIDGHIYATHDTCTHADASLADGFIVDGCKIECPLHQGLFDIKTGKAAGVPCTIDLETYTVKIHDGGVYLRDSAYPG